MIYERESSHKRLQMNLFDELIDARRKGMRWRDVAGHLQRLEASASLAPDGQPWIRAVEEMSGFSANHLRRMSRAFSVLGEIERCCPAHATKIAQLAYSHAEILARLWEAERGEVEQLLRSDGWPTYSELLARYENSRSRRAAPNAAGKLALGRFRDGIRMILSRSFGPDLRDPPPYHPYLKPDFLVIRGGDIVIAWDCAFLPGRVDEEALRRRFLAWATESTFVSAFWIVAQDNRAKEIIGRFIDELRLANVGLAAPADRALHPLIEPHGPPVPDRSKEHINRIHFRA